MDFAFPSPGIFPHYVPQHEQRGFPDIVTLSLVGELSAGNKTKSPIPALHCTSSSVYIILANNNREQGRPWVGLRGGTARRPFARIHITHRACRIVNSGLNRPRTRPEKIRRERKRKKTLKSGPFAIRSPTLSAPTPTGSSPSLLKTTTDGSLN